MDQYKYYSNYDFWKYSKQLAIKVHKATSNFPKSELFSLTNQMRRSAYSVPSNLAEGFGRNSEKEKERFCRIAMGSLYELQIQLEIASELKFLDEEVVLDLDKLITKVRMLIYGLIRSGRGNSGSVDRSP